jgi:hypothetical protein
MVKSPGATIVVVQQNWTDLRTFSKLRNPLPRAIGAVVVNDEHALWLSTLGKNRLDAALESA